ncbi:C-X-C chemokine receptor type 2-like [Carcharodon carcharias]|uniref:C-X-C chemokine receptor type 2-like n=1 Tax=Carcharodon carcharias TaxID=13397 RepID=UPI001B7F21C5|nr:C-X-C chemokine receptor type 2-like [Carcharodon carcharias]XP_041057371.1 C-X-C chemokine receptor type 2-like [Carcharodon carcharias]XP_041057372.1 C-X-C chemokine receptor type 2-like [Carcharodon carcharias]XP_041057373.1 C-X-C chemokine receptor type 2-like [Carcharodon carcharias]XP_041057374.1 C-X-C chemokine receptor type 2-like [Carcharodon carcharias]
MAAQKFKLNDVDFGDVFENYTYSTDYTNLPDMSPCTPMVNRSINTVIAIVYALVCFLAMAGNMVVMVVILSNRRTISSTDIFLLHLAVADLLFAVTLPFWAVDAISGWVFGDAMCKIISMLKEVNFYSGILLLACISIDRYLSIVYSIRTHNQKRPFLIKLHCAAVWVVAIVLSLPILYKGEYPVPGLNRLVCYELLDGESAETWRVTTRFLRHFIGFLIPLAVMTFCYSVTIWKLCQTKGFQKQKAMKVIIAVVLAFLICWLPHNITVFVDTLLRSKLIVDTCDKRYHIDEAMFATQTLGFLHSCINPILYAFIGVKFRKNLLKLLANKGCIKQSAKSQYRGSLSSTSVSGLIETTI